MGCLYKVGQCFHKYFDLLHGVVEGKPNEQEKATLIYYCFHSLTTCFFYMAVIHPTGRDMLVGKEFNLQTRQVSLGSYLLRAALNQMNNHPLILSEFTKLNQNSLTLISLTRVVGVKF